MARRGRTVLIVLGCIFGTLILLGVIGVAVGMAGQNEVRAYKLPAVDLSRIPDGTYEGSCDIGRFATKLAVTVKDHRVRDVAIEDGRRSNIGGKMWNRLRERVVGRETLVYDAVSGASITSKAFFIALTDALAKGMK